MTCRTDHALLLLGLAALALGAACSPGYSLDREQLKDPAECARCHPDHYAQWSGSMHAYAAEDPVFRAMNARGQRETGGALGDFCIKCHAPMAVRDGLTRDGLNLDALPARVKGVTCYFCHSVDAVEGTHDAPLRLATDGVLRGGIADPVGSTAHAAAWSPLHARDAPDSSSMCGSCHDIVTPGGVHLERTFAEWKETVFARGPEPQRLGCGGCHMAGREAAASTASSDRLRRVHDHSFVGVDVALTPFPNQEAQRRAIGNELDVTVGLAYCVDPDDAGARVRVTLDNIAAGHSWPSGATQDRRAWVELVAFDGGGAAVHAVGDVPDDRAVATWPGADAALFRARIYDAKGDPVHMFWEAARNEETLLGGHVTSDPNDPRYAAHLVERTFRIAVRPARLTLRVRIRPMDLDVLDDLVASGDLDPAIRSRVPTFTLAPSVKEWRADMGFGCFK